MEQRRYPISSAKRGTKVAQGPESFGIAALATGSGMPAGSDLVRCAGRFGPRKPLEVEQAAHLLAIVVDDMKIN